MSDPAPSMKTKNFIAYYVAKDEVYHVTSIGGSVFYFETPDIYLAQTICNNMQKAYDAGKLEIQLDLQHLLGIKQS